MVSASLAHRPSWWAMQIPGPVPLARQSASPWQGPQVFAARLQIGLAGSPAQSELEAHSTQPPDGAHPGFVASRVAHAVAGPAPQPTHAPPTHTGFVSSPEQSELAAHSWQVPSGP